MNDAGKLIAKIFKELPKYFDGILTDTYIVMPDHFHGIIIINRPVGAGLRARPEKEKSKSLKISPKFISKEYFKFFNPNKDNQIFSANWRVKKSTSSIGKNVSLNNSSKFISKENFRFYNHDKGNQIYSTQGRAQRPAPTGHDLSLGEIIGRFKSFTTSQYIFGVNTYKWRSFHEKLWQRGYYDRIIRNEKELFAIRKYIIKKPQPAN